MAGVESPEDLAAFFDPRDFGTEVVLWPGEGRERRVHAIFDRAWRGAEAGTEVEVSTSTPRLLGAATDFVGLQQDDALQAEGQQWRVYDLQPDGTGLLTVEIGT